MEEQKVRAIEEYILHLSGADDVKVDAIRLLSGGAIQENWLVDFNIRGGSYAGSQECVLRCDSPTAGVAISHSRVQEYTLLKKVFQAGVTVPEPLWLCASDEVIGRPFFVMRRIGGISAGHILAKDMGYATNRKELAQNLGRQLAKIHSIRPLEPELAFLTWYDESPAQHLINLHRHFLDTHHTPHPALEWGLSWLERHAPVRDEITLCHRDFRTGNYMVDERGLTGILDWEFAGWSDPMEDIGWFCAKCWRFGKSQLEAGGIGEREDFYLGYEAESKKTIDRTVVRYWEVMAHMNWAIIAIQQAERFISGQENSLLLALTGHIVPELEWEILNMTEIG